MKKAAFAQEMRISVRLSGPLADHANRLVESSFYNTHSEYIRDLIRRDISNDQENETVRKAWSDTYRQLSNGTYRAIPQKALFDQAMKELAAEGDAIKD